VRRLAGQCLRGGGGGAHGSAINGTATCGVSHEKEPLQDSTTRGSRRGSLELLPPVLISILKKSGTAPKSALSDSTRSSNTAASPSQIAENHEMPALNILFYIIRKKPSQRCLRRCTIPYDSDSRIAGLESTSVRAFDLGSSEHPSKGRYDSSLRTAPRCLLS
jgi:hypothetical protein